MGKPSKSDYKASEQEKVGAAIASADKDWFNKEYLPKTIEFVQNSFNEEGALISKAEGVASADTMQALTSNPNRNAVMSVDAEADLASAGAAQMLQGTTAGTVGARSDQISGIKMANNMAATTTAGLSQSSKLATSDTLNRMKAKNIRVAGTMKAGTTLGKVMGSNFQDYNAAMAANAKLPNENAPGYIDLNEDAGFFEKTLGLGYQKSMLG